MGTTPTASKPESKKSVKDLYDFIDANDPNKKQSDTGAPPVVKGFTEEQAAELDNISKTALDSTTDTSYELTPEAHRLDVEKASEDNIIAGYNFNYEYSNNDAYRGEDNAEIQAQKQPGIDKFKRGIGRLGVEFALNVAETPGFVLGGVAALATGDINKMTDNFWVNATASMKKAYQDYAPVYMSKHVRDAGVFDKMTSGSWVATEGVSALAFMGAALVPGLGVTKLGKMLSTLKVGSKAGAQTQRVLKAIDRFSSRLPGVDVPPGLAKEVGHATGQAANLLTTTMVNTVYEAGVEAKGSQESFLEHAKQLYVNGEISEDKYNSLIEESKTTAAKVFNRNVLLLAGPNAIMSKAMLGSKLAGTSKLRANMHFDGSKWVKGAKNATTKGFLNKPIVKGVGNIGKGFAKNTFREGVIEEMGQMAIEQYHSEERLNALLSGEDNRDFMSTYLKVVGSTDGQIAALTGGIISGPMSMRTRYLEGKALKKNIDEVVNSYNKSGNLYKALRDDIYKTDENGNLIWEEVDSKGNPVQEKGTGTLQRVVDPVKSRELHEAYTEVRQLNESARIAEERGDYITANKIKDRMQAQAFMPFLVNGKDGLKDLETMMLEEPATRHAVENYNKENNTSISVEDFVSGEMDKAEHMLNSMQFYDTHINTNVGRKWERDNLGNISKEESLLLDIDRLNYNNKAKSDYVSISAVEYGLKEDIKREEDNIASLKARKSSQELITQAEINKSELEQELKKVEDSRKEMESVKYNEKEWNRFFKIQDNTRKINNEEKIYDLNNLISSIKSARTKEELDIVIDKALEDGVLLPGVNEKFIPKEFEEFVATALKNNDLPSVIAGLTSMAMHEGIAQSKIEEYNNQINSLMRQAKHVGEEVVAALDKSIKEMREFEIEIEKYQEKLILLDQDIQKLNTALENSKSPGRYSKEDKLARAKLKRDLLSLKKLSSEISSKLTSTVISRNKAAKNAKSSIFLLQSLYNNAYTKEDKKYYSSLLEALNQELDPSIDKLKGTTPISLEKLLDRLTIEAEKETVEAARFKKDNGKVIRDLSHIKNLDLEIELLKALKKQIKSLIKEYDKVINEGENGFTTGLIELEAELVEVQIQLDKKLKEKNSKSSAHQKELTDILHSIELINEIISGNQEALKEARERAMSIQRPVEEEESPTNQVESTESEEAPKERDKDIVSDLNKHIIKRPNGPDVITNPLRVLTSNATDSEYKNSLHDAILRVKENKHKDSDIDFLYLAIKMNKMLGDVILKHAPNFTKEISKRGTVEAENSWKKYQEDKNFKGNKSPENKQGEKSSSKSTSGTKTSTNTNDTIKVAQTALKELIEAQKQSITEADLRLKLAAFQATLEETKLNGVDFIANGSLVTIGSEVFFFKKEGKELQGTVKSIIRGMGNGTNVVVQENGTNKIYVINSEAVSKESQDTNKENKVNNKAVQDSSNYDSTQNYSSPTIIIPIESNKTSTTRSVKPARQVKIGDKIVEVTNPFQSYLETPRDKSKDIITFSISKSITEKLIKSKDSDEERAPYEAALAVLEKLKKGKKVTEQEIDTLARYGTFSMRVTPSDPDNHAAGARLYGETTASEELNNSNFSIKKQILLKWFEAGNTKMDNKGTLNGVQATWAFQNTGHLNLSTDYIKLTDLKGITLDNLNLFTVGKEESMSIIGMNGNRQSIPLELLGKDGGVYLPIKANTGKDFNLRLKVATLKDTNELHFIMEVLDDLLLGGYDLDDTISGNLAESIMINSPLLYDIFEGPITYKDLYNTILYSGTKGSVLQTYFDNNTKTFRIGADVWNKEIYSKNRENIKTILGLKFRNINFPNSNGKSNYPSVNDKKYVKYIVETKAISTNLKPNANFFVAKEKTDNELYMTGPRVGLSTSSITIASDNTNNNTKSTKVINKPLTKVTRMTSAVRRKLEANGYDIRSVSQEALSFLNTIKRKGKEEFIAAIDAYNNTITAEKEKAGDSKIKKCR